MSFNKFKTGADRQDQLLIFREHCHGIVMRGNQHEMIYRKPDGCYETVRNFRGNETSHITTEMPKIRNIIHICDDDLGLTPLIDAKKPVLIQTRKFYELNCCAILMHQEKDKAGPIRVYKTPEGGAIVTFMHNGFEEFHRHRLFQMEYTSERIAPYLPAWPNMDWQRPKNWSLEL